MTTTRALAALLVWTAAYNGALLIVLIVVVAAAVAWFTLGAGRTRVERDAERRATFLLAAAAEVRIFAWGTDAAGIIDVSIVTPHAVGVYRTGLAVGQDARAMATAAGSLTTLAALNAVLRDHTPQHYTADWTSLDGERIVAVGVMMPTPSGGMQAFSYVVTPHVERAERAEAERDDLARRVARLDSAAHSKAEAERSLDVARSFLTPAGM